MIPVSSRIAIKAAENRQFRVDPLLEFLRPNSDQREINEELFRQRLPAGTSFLMSENATMRFAQKRDSANEMPRALISVLTVMRPSYFPFRCNS